MGEGPRKRTHKEWRKEVKKLRRKKIRQKLAEERNKKLAEEESARLNDPEYQSWLRNQEALKAAQLEQEEHQRQQQEELWLRRELLADKQFREQQRKHQASLAIKEAERLRIQKEFEELQQQAQKRREERKQREEQVKKDHEEMLDRIAKYIQSGGPIPEELTSNVQSNPNKPICPFFSKTNACRYGIHCLRNHIRPKLSKILFFPKFFTHIKLEQGDNDCGSDIGLEYTENQLRIAYLEFFEDVIEELKKFGEIENFRTCMNTQAHLRGNVFVEFSTAREAMKAYMELQGRYYASRQINVEFSSIVTWKTAICGLSYTRKCPKGRDCNFLHIFKNPGNLYNISVFKTENSIRKVNGTSTRGNSVMSWNDGDDRSSKRHWRWSESPEPTPNSSTNGDKASSGTNRKDSKERSADRDRRNRRRSRHEDGYCLSRSAERNSDRQRSRKRKSRDKDASESRERSCRHENERNSGRHRGRKRKSREKDTDSENRSFDRHRRSKEKSKDSRERSLSSRDSHRKEYSGRRSEEKPRSRSKSSERSSKRSKGHQRKKHHKEKKREHKSKRSCS